MPFKPVALNDRVQSNTLRHEINDSYLITILVTCLLKNTLVSPLSFLLCDIRKEGEISKAIITTSKQIRRDCKLFKAWIPSCLRKQRHRTAEGKTNELCTEITGRRKSLHDFVVFEKEWKMHCTGSITPTCRVNCILVNESLVSVRSWCEFRVDGV